MTQYIWQRDGWGDGLTWDSSKVIGPLARARTAQGRLLGRMGELGFALGQAIQLETVTNEAIGTAGIEGEELDRGEVQSSVARRLGLEAEFRASGRDVDGLVEVLLDATGRHEDALTEAKLQGWQAALFPTGFSGVARIVVGAWRSASEPMQVISGPFGHQRVHFEALPSAQVPAEMAAYLDWWHRSRNTEEGMIRAALAHFRFVTIHPFEDGNGRLARALTDMALAQDERTGLRLYSLSAAIRAERNDYYKVLERSQKGTGDLTDWLVWYLGLFERALARSSQAVDNVVLKDRFWRRVGPLALSERQIRVLNRLLDAGPGGFQGGLSTKRYVAMTKVSDSTARREIHDLVERGCLVQTPGTAGPGVRYEVAWDTPRRE